MPKSYTETERTLIRNRLQEEAVKCLSQYGVRHTTVDELVKRVHIPKGTFYLFYPSKEMLLFEVIQKEHERINRQLFDALKTLQPQQINAEVLTDLIYDFFRMTEQMLILKLMESGDVDLLVRKLPPETVQAHFKEDTDDIAKLFALLPIRKEVDIETVSAAFHAIYYATLHAQQIGENRYDQALRMLIHGVVSQIL